MSPQIQETDTSTLPRLDEALFPTKASPQERAYGLMPNLFSYRGISQPYSSFTKSFEWQYRLYTQDVTTSEWADIYFGGDDRIFREAWTTVSQHDNPHVVGQAETYLHTLQASILRLFGLRGAESLIPALHAMTLDDGSLLIEWIFPNFRIGVGFEPNPDESGWYLVSNRELGEINASGYLSGIELDKLVMWLIVFMLSQL